MQLQKRIVKGHKYLYVEKSIRIHDKVRKISEYLGREDKLTKKEIKQKKEEFAIKINEKVLNLTLLLAKKRYKKLEYPLSFEEIRKIEEMNLKYQEIKKKLSKNDWVDVKKRFIANFVFESNALEGNSLTLKNISDIIFEKKVTAQADLREIYDAQNSYKVFEDLLNSKKEITEKFIINIHKKILKNIDERFGYKKIPNIILGKSTKLTPPEGVPKEMKRLISWYEKNRKTMYPLELAFKFHQKFEKIHPFADGNGRVGRMLLNYILVKHKYFPIIIRKTKRQKYLKALDASDHNSHIPLTRFALECTKETYRKFFEIYYKYI